MDLVRPGLDTMKKTKKSNDYQKARHLRYPAHTMPEITVDQQIFVDEFSRAFSKVEFTYKDFWSVLPYADTIFSRPKIRIAPEDSEALYVIFTWVDEMNVEEAVKTLCASVFLAVSGSSETISRFAKYLLHFGPGKDKVWLAYWKFLTLSEKNVMTRGLYLVRSVLQSEEYSGTYEGDSSLLAIEQIMYICGLFGPEEAEEYRVKREAHKKFEDF